jgi:hypothetical protein
MIFKKKLIEVAIPMEAINAASAREKSIRQVVFTSLCGLRSTLLVIDAVLGGLVNGSGNVFEDLTSLAHLYRNRAI